MKLEIQDKDGNIIEEDELLVEKNDILIIQVTNPKMRRDELLQLSKTINDNLKLIFKPGSTPKALMLSTDFNLKVLKVRNE